MRRRPWSATRRGRGRAGGTRDRRGREGPRRRRGPRWRRAGRGARAAGRPRAEAVALLGDHDLAAGLYALLVPYAGRPLTAGRAIVSYGTADRHLGLLAGVLGRTAAAVAHLEAAVRLDEARGMRPWAARARLALAGALETSAEPGRAAIERARARAEADELGLAGFTAP